MLFYAAVGAANAFWPPTTVYVDDGRTHVLMGCLHMAGVNAQAEYERVAWDLDRFLEHRIRSSIESMHDLCSDYLPPPDFGSPTYTRGTAEATGSPVDVIVG